MELLREKLQQAIEKYGIEDKRVLNISQNLDIEVYKVQKEMCRYKGEK